MRQIANSVRKRLNPPVRYKNYSVENHQTYFRVGCIIRMCEKDIVAWLEEVGYKTDIEIDYTKHKEIITYKSGYYSPQEKVDIAKEERHQWIDCGTNKKEFFLLTGMSNMTKNRMIYNRKIHYRYAWEHWGINTTDEKNPYFDIKWKEAKPEEIVLCFGDETGDTIDDIITNPEAESWKDLLKRYFSKYGSKLIYK